MNRSITQLIEEWEKNKAKFEEKKKEMKIEKKIEQFDKLINDKRPELITDIKKNLEDRSLQDWMQKSQTKIKNQSNLPDSQIVNITEDTIIKPQEKNKNDINVVLEEEKKDEVTRQPNNPEINLKNIKSENEVYPKIADQSLVQSNQSMVLYNIAGKNKETNLYIYNTETGNKEVKILEAPEPLNCGTCIALLPNGLLFCYGKHPSSGISVIIDENYRTRELPSGTPCFFASGVYFNNNVYCFGGRDNNEDIYSLIISRRFDLERNQWFDLLPMPKADCLCHSIIFNGNILVSGYENRNLLRYSIGTNSFATILYSFASNKIKILINANRLYLIECSFGSIYESEIGSDTSWKKISYSKVTTNNVQVMSLYNKGAVFIGCYDNNYFKFDLSQKRFVNLKNNKYF